MQSMRVAELARAPVPPSGDFIAHAVHCRRSSGERCNRLSANAKLGEINARLGFTLSADFLAQLGLLRTRSEAQADHERDWPHICAALMRHIQENPSIAAGIPVEWNWFTA